MNIKKNHIYYDFNCNKLDSLLFNYFILRKNNEHQELEKILNEYSFNYTSSIHNAIYDLFSNREDISILWPGVYEKKESDDSYQLQTKNGLIKVNKASTVFQNHQSSYIFKKPLKGKSFARSLDFLKANRDYHVVLSYDDNLFVGGHYHAYLEKESETLDIVSNALYKTLSDKEKAFKGEIITKLTYEEAIDSFDRVLKEVPTLNKNEDKLQVLALYYASKKGIK